MGNPRRDEPQYPLFAKTERADEGALTVSELTSRIKQTMQSRFSSVWLTGEVSNLSRPRSGHIYLSLKDEGAQIRAVIWRATAARMDVQLEDGIKVLCTGDIDVYPPHGSYQIIIDRLEPLGTGALQLALNRLRERLAAEGLFDARRKRALPKIPRLVAVVTSPSGAAIRDFLEVARRRWPGVEILVVPTRVQGKEATSEIVTALTTVQQLRPRPDVVVATRGGGSLEDLWCFNEERVVRAVAASEIPVVSAVGHEIDVTLCDLAADVRALTPSEAAELVVPSAQHLRDGLESTANRMFENLMGRLQNARQRLESLANRRVLQRPDEKIRDIMRAIDDLELRLDRAVQTTFNTARDRNAILAGRLHSLSPLDVLARGYSITSLDDRDGTPIRNSQEINPGDRIRTRLALGELLSRVELVVLHKSERAEETN